MTEAKKSKSSSKSVMGLMQVEESPKEYKQFSNLSFSHTYIFLLFNLSVTDLLIFN